VAAAVAEPLARAGQTTIISQGGRPGDGTGAARLTDDVVQVLAQLTPIMQQLAGIDLQRFLQDVARLPSGLTQAAKPAKKSGEG
jgi:flotillin